jgi:hypothetical protein
VKSFTSYKWIPEIQVFWNERKKIHKDNVKKCYRLCFAL